MTAPNTRPPSRNVGITRNYDIAAAAHIYAGDFVMLNSGGYAQSAGNLASNKGCVGIAIEEQDNTNGANAALQIKVQDAEWLVADDGGETLTRANEGASVFCNPTSKAVHLVQAANDSFAGVITEFDSSTGNVWVATGPLVNSAIRNAQAS